MRYTQLPDEALYTCPYLSSHHPQTRIIFNQAERIKHDVVLKWISKDWSCSPLRSLLQLILTLNLHKLLSHRYKTEQEVWDSSGRYKINFKNQIFLLKQLQSACVYPDTSNKTDGFYKNFLLDDLGFVYIDIL